MGQQYTFVLDVDGVLTTGQFLYSVRGKVYKVFGPHDADGFRLLKGRLDIFLITADHRGFPISKKRADDLGLKIVLVSEAERFEYLKNKVGFKNLIYMGDGLFDAPILKACQFGIAPASARKEAKAAADYVTGSRAGEGAVLDACLEIKRKLFKGK